jgi:hypothetical protein
LFKASYVLTVTNPNSPSQVSQVVINNSDPSAVNEMTLPALRTVSGKLLHADGTPAPGVSVRWTADSTIWSYQPTVATTSGLDGSYSLQVAPVPGLLWVQSALGPFAAGSDVTRNLPAGFNAGGGLTPSNSDQVINLTLPKFRDVTLTVTDELTGAGIPGALIESTNRNQNCQAPYFSSRAGNYSLFPGAKVWRISNGCNFFNGTFSGRRLSANAQGQANAQQEALNAQYAIAQQNEKNILLMSQLGKDAPKEEKSKLPLYIGLGVGGVLVLGVIIFAVTRNKS